MKRIDIEKKLKSETDEFTPNPLDKIKQVARAQNLLPYDAPHNSESYVQNNVRVAKKRKNKLFALIAAVMAFVICLVLILTFTLNINKDKPFSPFEFDLSAQDIYGIGAVSGVKLLGSNMSVNALKTLSQINAVTHNKLDSVASENSEELVKEQAEKFNQYFTALDSFLGEDIISTSIEKNPDSKYPFDTKMTINGKDLSGKTVTYVMYYTETLTNNNSEDDEDDDDDEYEYEDDSENECEYKLVGIILIDGIRYHLEGERSVETEQDETENELKIRAYANPADKTSYIEMEQEFSVENGETETEYVYSIYANGILLEQTAIEFEVEDKGGKVETEYELEFINGSAKGKYVVKREVKDNKAEIKVKYNIDGNLGEFRIREIIDKNGNKLYEYTFQDNDKLIFQS